MKTTSIPLRVSADLRKRAESLLDPGETLSSFASEALTRSIEYRKSRQEFIERGLQSSEQARSTGKYISADAVLDKLARKLARRNRARPRRGHLDWIGD